MNSHFLAQGNTAFCYWYCREVFSLTRKIFCPSHWIYCEVNDNCSVWEKKKSCSWEDCSKRKGSESNLIVAQWKWWKMPCFFWKTSQTFEKCAFFSHIIYPIILWLKHATFNLHWILLVYFIWKVCHAINVSNSLFSQWKTSLEPFFSFNFSIARDIR